MSKDSIDVNNLDLERASSSSIEFKDIETYSRLVETMLDNYLDFKDNVSVISAKTV